MRHIAFSPTDEQRANLLRLAAHLDLGVTNHRFDMRNYQAECGTVACACGHGPSLGISIGQTEDWASYAGRVFGTWRRRNQETHYWLFAADWKAIDNTPRGAAARIFYALKHGTPANWQSQMNGTAPLSYSVPDRVEGPAVKVMA